MPAATTNVFFDSPVEVDSQTVLRLVIPFLMQVWAVVSISWMSRSQVPQLETCRCCSHQMHHRMGLYIHCVQLQG